MVTKSQSISVTIMSNILYLKKPVKIFSNNSNLKSRGDFRFWTFLKMSNLRNPKIVLKNSVKKRVSELNALKNIHRVKNVVTITFSQII
jgi:hypothetical protein